MRMKTRLAQNGYVIRAARRAALGMLAVTLTIASGAVAQSSEGTHPCDLSDLCKAMYAVISQRKAIEIRPPMPLAGLLPTMSAADIRTYENNLRNLENQNFNAQIVDHISQRFGHGLSSADRARTLSYVRDPDLKGWLFHLAKVIDSPPAMMNAELDRMAQAYVFETPNLKVAFNPVRDSITDLHQKLEDLNDKLELGTLCINDKDDDSDGFIDGKDPDCALGTTDTDEIKARRTEILVDRSNLYFTVRDSAARFRTLKSVFGSQVVRQNGTVADLQSNLASVLEETFFNHFNVDYDKVLINAGMGPGGYEPTIHSQMFSTFHDLLSSVIKHPAMLVYLDNRANKFDLVNKVASNQNLGRELLELHTLGLGPDRGWRGADGSIQPKLYTQKDVENSALVLTGLNVGAGKMDEMGAFKYGTEVNYLAHVPDYLGSEQTSPVVMGKRFCLFDGVVRNGTERCGLKPANIVALEKSSKAADKARLKSIMVSKINTQLDNYLRFLSNHERTKINICTKLVNRFVVPDYIPTGVPTGVVDDLATRIDESMVMVEVQRSAVVDRCIAAWGQDGDLKAIYRAILTSPQVWAARNYQRMTKNPNDLVISAIRASGVTVKDFTNAKEVKALGVQLKAEIGYLGLPYRQWDTPTGYNERFGWMSQGYLVRWISSSFRLASFLESRSDVGERGAEHYAPIMGIASGGELTGSKEQSCRVLVDSNNQPDGKKRYEFVRQLLGYGNLRTEANLQLLGYGNLRTEANLQLLGFGDVRTEAILKLLGYWDVRTEANLIRVKTERMMSKDGSDGTGENYLMVKQKINGAWGPSCVKSGLTTITASPRFLRQ